MKKIFIYYSLGIYALIAIMFLLLFFVYGCGTRKVEAEKKETQTDQIAVINSSIESEKIVLGTSFIYTPVDGLKPMVIDGRKFENAIVSGGTHKETSHIKWMTQKYNITKTITIEKTKIVDRTDNTMLWVLIAFIGCLFVFLWFYLPKIK